MRRADRLRIALFTYSTQPRGGVLHALALAEALTDAGHQAVLFALDDTGRGFIRAPRCPVVLVPVAPNRESIVPFVRARIEAYVCAFDPSAPAFDVYHAHDGISGNALATLAERGAIADFVRTVHHVDDFALPELTALQDRAIVRAARCLVVSDLWRSRLEATYGVRATVVPNGVDVERFAPADAVQRAGARAALGYGPGPLFVTIGGVEARKNTLATLEAFARVRARLPNARLIVAGGASVLDHTAYRAAFEARAAALALRLGVHVHLAGTLADAAIVTLLHAADAFVFPSLVEGFGLVLLEALACATPVVASAIAPFTEFLTPADALLVDPRDPAAIASAMLGALESDVVRRTAERGPALARRFSWPGSAQAHADIYAAFCASRQVAARA